MRLLCGSCDVGKRGIGDEGDVLVAFPDAVIERRESTEESRDLF